MCVRRGLRKVSEGGRRPGGGGGARRCRRRLCPRPRANPALGARARTRRPSPRATPRTAAFGPESRPPDRFREPRVLGRGLSGPGFAGGAFEDEAHGCGQHCSAVRARELPVLEVKGAHPWRERALARERVEARGAVEPVSNAHLHRLGRGSRRRGRCGASPPRGARPTLRADPRTLGSGLRSAEPTAPARGLPHVRRRSGA